LLQDKSEDTNLELKNRQYNDQKKMNKSDKPQNINNPSQRLSNTNQIARFSAPEGGEVPAPLVATVVLLLVKIW
jgi:biotin carboxyl carrier protein